MEVTSQAKVQRLKDRMEEGKWGTYVRPTARQGACCSHLPMPFLHGSVHDSESCVSLCFSHIAALRSTWGLNLSSPTPQQDSWAGRDNTGLLRPAWCSQEAQALSAVQPSSPANRPQPGGVGPVSTAPPGVTGLERVGSWAGPGRIGAGPPNPGGGLLERKQAWWNKVPGLGANRAPAQSARCSSHWAGPSAGQAAVFPGVGTPWGNSLSCGCGAGLPGMEEARALGARWQCV